MLTRYRIVTLAVLGAVAVSFSGHFLDQRPGSRQASAPPPLLPAAHASLAAVGFQDTLRNGETITDLLRRTQIAEDEARLLVAQLQQFQDPRRLHAGSVISYRKSPVTGSVREMELRLDPDRTLNFERSGSAWTSSVEEVPVRPDTQVLAGSVESSLYAALTGAEASSLSMEERQEVADVLADRIFAWQVDFSRDLQPGDRYRILYERMRRPDGTARSGRVIGVEFSVAGRNHGAYRFALPDGAEDYYDRRGESLRRAFLRAPLEFRRISSAFATSRFHPILKQRRPHWGVDYAAASGTPVRAVGDGVVRRAGWGGAYGNVVEINHKRGYSSRYAHLKGMADGIRAGVRVTQGDVIGYVGSTGLSTAPHLHYEFHSGGKPINPSSIKHITGEPIPGRYLAAFGREIAAQMRAMDRKSKPVLLLNSPAAARTRKVD